MRLMQFGELRLGTTRYWLANRQNRSNFLATLSWQGQWQINRSASFLRKCAGSSMGLWQDFLINEGKIIHKWVHYFPIYEKHFHWYTNKSLTFLEIGVSKGGSLQMWQRYFGPLAKVVGIDVDEKCKAHEAPDSLNADHSRGAIPADFITRGTFSISFYDSVIVFEKGDVWRKEAPRTGRDSIAGTIDTAVDSIRGAIINRIKGR